MARAIHSIKGKILGREFEAPDREEDYKACALFNQRTFSRDRKKWEYLESVIECATNFPVVSFFVVMEKPTEPDEVRPGHLPNYTRFLLQRIDAYVASEEPTRKAILLFDSCDPASDRRLSEAIGGFLFRHRVGITLTHVLETPLFVESSIVPGIQVADYFVSAVRQHHEHQLPTSPKRSEDYLLAMERVYRSVKRTVKDTEMPDGRPYYGEYIMDSRWFGAAPPDLEPDTREQ